MLFQGKAILCYKFSLQGNNGVSDSQANEMVSHFRRLCQFTIRPPM
jgi:hypothetical protein